MLRIPRGEFQIEQCRQFPGDAAMAEAITSIARDLDIDDGVIAERFGDLDGKSAVRQRIGRRAGSGNLRQELAEPFQANFHGPTNLDRRAVVSNDRSPTQTNSACAAPSIHQSGRR